MEKVIVSDLASLTQRVEALEKTVRALEARLASLNENVALREIEPVYTSDSSVIIALWQVSQLDLLPALFQEVFIPPAVASEIYTPGKAGSEELYKVDWLKILSLPDPSPNIWQDQIISGLKGFWISVRPKLLP